ncbi:MAG: sugar ABC transporter permease [Clostridia bacterium]|nr:sugar ABC transporter permease [Clostridia bacterium]
MDTSVKQSRIKPSKIVMVIAAVVMLAFIVAAVVLGVNIPQTTRLYPSDGGTISSVTETDGEEWFLSTRSNVMRLNAKGETLETYSLKDITEKNGIGDASKVEYIRSILKPSRDSKDFYVYTAQNYLIQLREKDGELTYNGVTQLTGTVNALREKDGILYVLNSYLGNMKISKFDVNNLSAGALATGYVYKVEMQQNAVLSYLQNLLVHSFEIVECMDMNGNVKDYVSIVHPDGIIRFDTDFTFNGYQDELKEKVDVRTDELCNADPDFAGLSDVDKTAKRAEYTNVAAQEIAAQYASDGIVAYDAKVGTIQFDFNKFLMAGSYVYSLTEEAYRGAGYDADKNKYYLITKDSCVYTVDVDDIPVETNDFVRLKNKLGGITLPLSPRDEGHALAYNDTLKVGYVFYEASSRISRIDFNTGELTFTTQANDDINTIIQNGNGVDNYYLYRNKNEAASGEFILRHIGIENQEYYFLLQGFMITAIVLAVVAAIVVLLSALCAYKPGFSEKFQKTMKLVKKHWLIYVVLAASFSLVGMFCYYPAIGSIALSFFDYTVENESKVWNNFANYAEVFTSSKAGLEFSNMLLFLATDIFTALLPPLIFAFFLTIMRNKNYSAVMRTLLFIPGVIPGVATTLIWKSGIYDYPNGVINMVIQLFNGTPFDFMHDKIGTRISIIMMGFPFVGSYLIFYGAMMNVPDSYYEAAELDGITVIKRFIWIDVPLIAAQIKYVLIMTFISSVQNFGRTYMTDMNNIYDTNTPIHTMYDKIQTQGNYGLASAYASVLFVFLFAATVFNMYSKRREGGDE